MAMFCMELGAVKPLLSKAANTLSERPKEEKELRVSVCVVILWPPVHPVRAV
jgi:hypothetical protein